MRKIYLLLLFITSHSFAQKELNLDNNLTCNTVQADNTIRSVAFNYIGDNTLTLKNFDINSNTNYTYLTDKQNELLQRFNVMYKFPEKKFDDYSFFTYQFNSSLIRKIDQDHWVGLGYGVKKKIDSTLAVSTSYAIIFQDILWSSGENKTFFRHSLRGKVKLTKNNFEIVSEYFYQPNIQYFDEYIIIGTTKLVILPKNKLNFIVQDVVNYNSTTEVKLLHTISLGIQYKFNKKF
jgi:hypothetical protein